MYYTPLFYTLHIHVQFCCHDIWQLGNVDVCEILAEQNLTRWLNVIQRLAVSADREVDRTQLDQTLYDKYMASVVFIHSGRG